MSVSDAVSVWKQYIEPLAQKGIKLGTPAVSGSPNGFQWMQDFISQCTGCSIGFIALHYYGPSDGLASHLAQYNAKFPDKMLWLTEWADSNDSLDSTTTNTKAMLALLDSLSYVERYSYFGAVRSNVCNVGPNAALLDTSGNLNSLGQMYMSGGSVAGPSPSTPIVSAAPTTQVTPTTFATRVSTYPSVPHVTSSRTATVVQTISVHPTVAPHNTSSPYVSPTHKNSTTAAAHHHKHTHTRHHRHRYSTTPSVQVMIATATEVKTMTAFGRYNRK